MASRFVFASSRGLRQAHVPLRSFATYQPAKGTFRPPADVGDLTSPNRKLWSQRIFDMFRESSTEAGNNRRSPDDFIRRQWFNPLVTPVTGQFSVAPIDWVAFPRVVRERSPSDQARWAAADASRDVQDEYCEWSVTRDSNGKIVRVDFTAEGPEYWEFLAAAQPDKVVELYRQHVAPNVPAAQLKSEIFSGTNGAYNKRNRYNRDTTNGVMHLIMRANTLSAEVELAAAATVIRHINGKDLTTAQDLIGCSKYGVSSRNSDPHIGASVNQLARQGAMITLADPVGLYIKGFSPLGWETPDGSDPASYWKITRGDENTALRAVYEVPADRNFKVGDITINGMPIEYGSQIADFIRIKLAGLATNINVTNRDPVTFCN